MVREARCTSIRLPIGYFTLGEEFCEGTPFEKVASVGSFFAYILPSSSCSLVSISVKD